MRATGERRRGARLGLATSSQHVAAATTAPSTSLVQPASRRRWPLPSKVRRAWSAPIITAAALLLLMLLALLGAFLPQHPAARLHLPALHLLYSSSSVPPSWTDEASSPPLYSEEQLLPRAGSVPLLYKSAGRRARDRRCLMRNKARLNFLHMRKAGGTSIHYSLRQCDSTWGSMDFHYAEYYSYDVACMAEDAGPMVQITSLRDPMERIVSSYFFEGRTNWTTKDLHIEYHSVVLFKRDHQRKESRDPLAFHEWVAWLQAVEPTYPTDFRRNRVEVSVDNYYIRSLVTRHRPDLDAPIGPDDLELAKRILASFDMVLINEWLGSPEQQAYFQSYLGITECPPPKKIEKAEALRLRLPGAVLVERVKSGRRLGAFFDQSIDEGIKIAFDFYKRGSEEPRKGLSAVSSAPPLRATVRAAELKSSTNGTVERGFTMPHANPNKASRRGELEADPKDKATLDALYELNKWDRALYEWARHLVRARMAAHVEAEGRGRGPELKEEEKEGEEEGNKDECPPLPPLPEYAPLSTVAYELAALRDPHHKRTDLGVAFPIAQCMWPVIKDGWEPPTSRSSSM